MWHTISNNLVPAIIWPLLLQDKLDLRSETSASDIGLRSRLDILTGDDMLSFCILEVEDCEDILRCDALEEDGCEE